jgi:hypothetical protein
VINNEQKKRNAVSEESKIGSEGSADAARKEKTKEA